LPVVSFTFLAICESISILSHWRLSWDYLTIEQDPVSDPPTRPEPATFIANSHEVVKSELRA